LDADIAIELELLNGTANQVFPKIIQTFCKKKIAEPGDYLSKLKIKSVDCVYYKDEGNLYPMDKGFFFVHKPPMYIKFKEITSIEFIGGDNVKKSFDINITLKKTEDTPIVFNNIAKKRIQYFIFIFKR